ncbi:MAG: rhamnogalacturonan acetylesterase [Verrucomicrobiota bacterium]|jgi:lysophospholipase L1-like esterase
MKTSARRVRFLALPVVIALLGAGGCEELAQWHSSPDPATVAPERPQLEIQTPLWLLPTYETVTNSFTNYPELPLLVDNRAWGAPTIFVAGDSTAARGAGDRQQGWAVPFATYFDPAKVNIVNSARGGRSSRTFVTEGLWDALLAEVTSNDFVLIQFGQNDGGAVNDTLRARGSLPGVGEETQEIDNLITKKHEVVHTFGWYMLKMIADTKAKGAKPIVIGPTVRDIWSNGKVERGPGLYTLWSKDVAKAAGVPFVDLTDLVADQFDQLGEDRVKLLYPQDSTHFNLAGAKIHASNVIAGLRELRGDPIASYLKTPNP